MTLYEACNLTFEPIRNIFAKAIDALGTEECEIILDNLGNINDLDSIDDKADAQIAFLAFKNQPNHELYEKAVLNINLTHKGNVNELITYRNNISAILNYVEELKLQIYGWKYVTNMFINSLNKANKRWTKEEDNELIDMACEGFPEIIMAARLKRNPSAIKTRMSYLVGVKRLSQKVAGKFIGEINGEQTEAELSGTIYKE